MGRKSSTKRSKRQQAVDTAVTAPVAGAGGAGTSGRRALLIAAALLVTCGAVGFGAAKFFASPSSAAVTPPKIVEGDGVNGPKGMAWIPGGEFLMGSEHKLAQKNERPAHKVRVAGFWM